MRASDVIHAEIEITTESDLPAQLSQSLGSWFAGASSISAALAETILLEDYDILSSVVYGRITSDAVFLVLSESRRSIKVHVQRRLATAGVAELKRLAERLAEQFADYMRHHDRRCRKLQISIYAGRGVVQTGSLVTRWQKAARIAAAEALTTVSLGLGAILVSYLFSADVRRALLDGLIAVFALSLRIVVNAVTHRPGYEYA